MNIIARSRHLGSWDPFRELERANNLFSLLHEASNKSDRRGDLVAELWGPAVDIQDFADKITVKADLPGIDRKDVDVSVEDAALVIRGEKKEEAKTREKGYVRTERAYGNFYRAIELPAEVDEARVTAQYKDGVLEIVLPKRQEAKVQARKVEIK